MKFDELYNVSQWTKNFWNPFIPPILSTYVNWDMCNRNKSLSDSANELYKNFYDGIKSHSYKWHDTDSEEHYNKNKQHKELNPKYHNKDINYTFNAHGYRSEPFDTDSDLKILTLGCSVAFGTGVDDKDVWCNNISNKAKVYNISIPGASADLNAISLYQLIDIIKPNIVLWSPTNPGRRLVNRYFLTEMESSNVFKNDDVILSELQHNHQSVLPSREQYMPYYQQITSNCENYNNLTKNYAIMNEICENNNILFKSFHPFSVVYDSFSTYKKIAGFGQDDMIEHEKRIRLEFETLINASINKLPMKYLGSTKQRELSHDLDIPTVLFDKLDNVINYIDVKDYASEFFKNQTRECIEENIKYPYARDLNHPTELYHQFLAYISRNVLLKEGVKL
jgi:hypothetical protein